METTIKQTRIEAYGVKGMKNISWRKTFKNVDALNKWIEKNDAVVMGYRDIEDRSEIQTTAEESK